MNDTVTLAISALFFVVSSIIVSPILMSASVEAKGVHITD